MINTYIHNYYYQISKNMGNCSSNKPQTKALSPSATCVKSIGESSPGQDEKKFFNCPKRYNEARKSFSSMKSLTSNNSKSRESIKVKHNFLIKT